MNLNNIRGHFDDARKSCLCVCMYRPVYVVHNTAYFIYLCIHETNFTLF